jgi:hypothetical protein
MKKDCSRDASTEEETEQSSDQKNDSEQIFDTDAIQESDLKTDRYGFLESDGFHSSLNISKKVDEERKKKEAERTKKWLKMLRKSKNFEEVHSKLKERARKGIPDSLRGTCWKWLCKADEFKAKYPNPEENFKHLLLDKRTSDEVITNLSPFPLFPFSANSVSCTFTCIDRAGHRPHVPPPRDVPVRGRRGAEQSAAGTPVVLPIRPRGNWVDTVDLSFSYFSGGFSLNVFIFYIYILDCLYIL